MSQNKLDSRDMNLSIADISSAVAVGLQRAIDTRELGPDRVLIYGGRLDFNIQIHPQNAAGVLRETANISNN